jgi:hypothetical protein
LVKGTWTQTGADIDGEVAWDFSGFSVAMSGDGSYIAIGAPLNDGNGGIAGHVRVYGAPPALVEPTTTTVAASTTTTVAKTIQASVVKLNKSTSAKSIAVFAKLTVASSSKVRLTVAGSSVKICKASDVSVRGIKVGMCKLRVTVTPKKGKPVTRNVSLKVSK